MNKLEYLKVQIGKHHESQKNKFKKNNKHFTKHWIENYKNFFIFEL